MQYGKRLIYDATNGNVLNYCLEEMQGVLQEGLRPIEISFIDLPFGSTILNNVATYHIDITKDKTSTAVEQMIVIDSMIPNPPPTYAELQQQLLVAQGVI